MTIAIASPFSGAAVTGFTSPTYNPVLDRAPDAANGIQYAVTGGGGTQVGVTYHTNSNPFTMTFVRPKNVKKLGQVNPITGALPSVPKNQWVMIFRKGVIPLAGQAPSIMTIRVTIDIPAGADTADAPNVKALLSAFMGQYWHQSIGVGDSVLSGIL